MSSELESADGLSPRAELTAYAGMIPLAIFPIAMTPGAILPALCGVAAVILGGQRGLGLLVIALGLFWLYEHRSVGSELPPDYVRLRRNLSLAGCSLLAFTMILSDYVGLL